MILAIDGVFDLKHADLADCYKSWGRCLAVMDLNISADRWIVPPAK